MSTHRFTAALTTLGLIGSMALPLATHANTTTAFNSGDLIEGLVLPCALLARMVDGSFPNENLFYLVHRFSRVVQIPTVSWQRFLWAETSPIALTQDE